NQPVEVEVTVTYTGKVSSEEVVQLYISHVDSKIPAPLFSLNGIKRVNLAPGASEKVKFTITPQMYSVINDKGVAVIQPGKVRVSVGGSLPGSRSEALGSAKAVQAIFTVK